MAIIGNEINGVRIKFAPAVNWEVDPRMIQGLRRAIQTDIADEHVLNEIFIASANDQHELPSRHVQGGGKAIDISRINGMKMSVYYASSKSVKAIVDAIQAAFEGYPHRRENFGPSFLNPIDADIEKNLQLRLYRVPISQNECFVETHGICQYEYLLSVSSFDEQPEVNVFKLPLVGEISRIGWRKHSGIDEAVIEVSLNRYSEAALKNNPALRNATSQHVLIVNLKAVTVTAVNH